MDAACGCLARPGLPDPYLPEPTLLGHGPSFAAARHCTPLKSKRISRLPPPPSKCSQTHFWPTSSPYDQAPHYVLAFGKQHLTVRWQIGGSPARGINEEAFPREVAPRFRQRETRAVPFLYCPEQGRVVG
jgi:hypothetical protein